MKKLLAAMFVALLMVGCGDSPYDDAETLARIRKAKESGKLYLRSNEITDLMPLAGLTKLTYLNLGDNQIADLAPLAGQTNLAELFLGENRITQGTGGVPALQFILGNLKNQFSIGHSERTVVLPESLSSTPQHLAKLLANKNRPPTVRASILE